MDDRMNDMLWLFYVKNMWHKKMRKLLEYFHTPKEIYTASEKQLFASGLKDADVEEIVKTRNQFDFDKERKKLEESQILFVTEEHRDYPEKLKLLPDRPPAIFLKGKRKEALHTPAAAVIGARVCSHYGRSMAEKFAAELAEQGITIVSGLARGVDAAAHRGAIAGGGITCAVLGCGVDICYPPEHLPLYEQIVENGVILSEYPPGTKPNAWQFPQRNRLISGLSDCIVITEAREKSGSLITAKHALEQGVDVCAVPGRADDALSLGCNRLIKEGAYPATEVSDILSCMGINYKKIEKNKIFLEKKNEVVYSVLGLYPQSMEEIRTKTGIRPDELYGILLQLQLMGLAEEPVKNYYIRKE